MDDNLEVSRAELIKVWEVLMDAVGFHQARDTMNGRLHLGPPIDSPLTLALLRESAHLQHILGLPTVHV